MKVIVVGAGIIGTLTAYRLAQTGAKVTMIDAGQPTGAASGASFGWINASFYADQDHFNLRAAGLEAHRRLARDLQSDAIQWPGCLCWEHEGEALDQQFRALKNMGYMVSEVSAIAFAQMEPFAVAPPRALHFSGEGVVDLVALAYDACIAGRRYGLRSICGVSVIRLIEKNNIVSGVETTAGPIVADRIVIAAGVATQSLLAGVDVALPMLKRPGVMVRSEPLQPLLRHVLVGPGQEVRQTKQGHILAPGTANHQGDDSETITEEIEGLASQAMARVRDMIGREVAWEDAAFAHRPVPEDGLPVIGACGPAGLYVTVMHSGATLAALVGELAAAEIMDVPLSNIQSALLSPYRVDRFTA